MNARQIIENQQELIELLRAEVERQKQATTEAYQLASYAAYALLDNDKRYSPTIGVGCWNSELLFEQALKHTKKQTAYQFKTRVVDPKYLISRDAKVNEPESDF